MDYSLKEHKINLVFIVGVLVLSVGFVSSIQDYGYTSFDGRQVFYDEELKINGIHNPIQSICRLPNECELTENRYLPMSCLE